MDLASTVDLQVISLNGSKRKCTGFVLRAPEGKPQPLLHDPCGDSRQGILLRMQPYNFHKTFEKT